MLTGSSMNCVVVVLNKKKADFHGIKFIDASDLGCKKRSENVLNNEDINNIVGWLNGTGEPTDSVRQLSVAEIENHNPNLILSVKRYINKDLWTPTALSQAYEDYQQAELNFKHAEANLLSLIS